MSMPQSAALAEQARNLEHGTWIIVAWKDSPPTMALFLRYKMGSKKDGSYPKNFMGDRSMSCYYPNDKIHGRHVSDFATHSQVLAVLGKLDVPPSHNL